MASSESRRVAHSLDLLIRHQSNVRGDAAFLVDARSGASLSYADLRSQAAATAKKLTVGHLDRGGRVGLLLRDPLTFSAWFLTALAAGFWVAPLDPTLPDGQLLFVDERVASLDLQVVVSDRRAPAGVSAPWVGVDDSVGECARARLASTRVVGDDRGGVLLASSGTTGAPKVVALSIEQLLANASFIAHHNQLRESDRGFSPLPLWHVNAEVVGLLATLVAGASLVLDDRFHRTGFWDVIAGLDVTWINAVPAIISRLVSGPDSDRAPAGVRFVRSASAPLSPALSANFESLTGIPIIESYGMTEAASQICVNPLYGVRKVGSVGPAVGASVRVVALDGAGSVDAGVVGHVEIKGSTVITTYESAAYDDRFDQGGWLRTGDLGHLDEDGYLFLVGRADDVINRGGEKVYPLEIEHVLSDLDGVAAVAVVGEAHDVFGHVPVAYVQPRDVEILSSHVQSTSFVERVRAVSLASLSKSSRPASVKLVESFPVHATGKIRKGMLRDGEVVVAFEELL